MLRTQPLCQPSLWQNRQQRRSPRSNLNFSPSTKKTTEYSSELFLFILLFPLFPIFQLFLSIPSFQIQLCEFTPKRRIHVRVISTVCHLLLVTLWCRLTDGWKDGHVTIASLVTKMSWFDRLPNLLSNGAVLQMSGGQGIKGCERHGSEPVPCPIKYCW